MTNCCTITRSIKLLCLLDGGKKYLCYHSTLSKASTCLRTLWVPVHNHLNEFASTFIIIDNVWHQVSYTCCKPSLPAVGLTTFLSMDGMYHHAMFVSISLAGPAHTATALITSLNAVPVDLAHFELNLLDSHPLLDHSAIRYWTPWPPPPHYSSANPT